MTDVAPPVPQRASGGALIETKLHTPALRKEWVQREDLIGYLAGCSSSRLVLVAAPAGSGKSIAVAQWAASMIEDRPFAWVSLDRGDDDPARLWFYVVSALQRACPQFGGEDILRALRAPIPDISGTVLPDLVNELAELPAPVVVVLDDYHVISDHSCHDQVAFLLSRLPGGVQLVLYLSGEPDAAAALLTEALASAASISAARVAALSLLAVVRVEQGQAGRAQELVRTARQLVGDSDLAETQQGSSVWMATGAVCAAQGRIVEARAEFEHALRICRRWSGITPWPVIDSMVRLAAVLSDLGERPAAAALAGEARQLLTACPDRAQAQWDRLHRLERRLSRPLRGVAGHPLTEREVTVLRLLRGALSLREIGQELYLSPNTVKTHVRAAYRKLRVSTRQDAITRAHEIGVL
jgi:ATP/maltotriose-dependent transcriptional regulator MalT